MNKNQAAHMLMKVNGEHLAVDVSESVPVTCKVDIEHAGPHKIYFTYLKPGRVTVYASLTSPFPDSHSEIRKRNPESLEV
jgi:hypothetical protein